MVWRRSKAGLRGHDPRASSGQKNCGNQAADRRGRMYHAMELSAGDDYAQGGPGDCGWLHGGAEARGTDSVFRTGLGGARGASRRAEGRVQCNYGPGARNWRRTDVESDREEAFLYWIDGNRKSLDGAVRGDDQEAVAGTRRQRAVHRS